MIVPTHSPDPTPFNPAPPPPPMGSWSIKQLPEFNLKACKGKHIFKGIVSLQCMFV